MFFRKILQIDNFEDADFKYDNSFLKFLPKKYPNQAFLVPNSGIFVFVSEILQTDKFEGVGFKYDNRIVLNSCPKVRK